VTKLLRASLDCPIHSKKHKKCRQYADDDEHQTNIHDHLCDGRISESAFPFGNTRTRLDAFDESHTEDNEEYVEDGGQDTITIKDHRDKNEDGNAQHQSQLVVIDAHAVALCETVQVIDDKYLCDE